MTQTEQTTQTVRSFYMNQGLGEISPVRLIVTSREEMHRISGLERVNGLASNKNREYTIYVYQGLSPTRFALVYAHEILHIWQFQHKIEAERKICEGFCELGRYLFAKTLLPDAEAMDSISRTEKAQDPIYGDGFRYMLAIYQSSGWAGVLAEMYKYRPQVLFSHTAQEGSGREKSAQKESDREDSDRMEQIRERQLRRETIRASLCAALAAILFFGGGFFLVLWADGRI